MLDKAISEWFYLIDLNNKIIQTNANFPIPISEG